MGENIEFNKGRWFVVVNPVAGRGNGLADWPIISKLLRDNGIMYDAVFTEKKYHATELTVEAICKGYRKIIVVGGDGTLHEVVNGVFIQDSVASVDITLAVTPVGTGNDWVRMFGIAHRYTDSIRAIVEGRSIIQDIGHVRYYESKVHHTRYMANMAGFGLDSYASGQYGKRKEKGLTTGKLAYTLILLRSLLFYNSIPMKIWVDGELVIDGKVLTGVVGIGKYNGGGMLQAPMAIPDDGLFDVTIIFKASNWAVVRYFKSLFDGNIYKVPSARFFRGKHIKIEANRGLIEVDGEVIGCAPYEFTSLYKMIRVIVGDSYR